MTKMKELIILGSTGSIGTQSIEVCEQNGYRVTGLAAGRNIKLLEEQARKLKPLAVACSDEAAARLLKIALKDTDIKVLSGEGGVCELAAGKGDTVLNSIVGIAGLRPTLSAIDSGKTIALANKETLVTGGELVKAALRKNNVKLLPVDSEHSAIFQSLQGAPEGGVRKILLTASGGPFYGKKTADLEGVTAKEALKHPNWSMGAKITVDSATLMNKCLEFIESMHLYHMPPEKISVVVHRESIIHSLVEYCDNAMIAQMGVPDMKLPIQYALTYPDRVPSTATTPFDIWNSGALTFGAPDPDTFRCLALALKAAETGGTAGAILNGANEAAVAQFLDGKIGFLDIAEKVALAMEKIPVIQDPGLLDILEADAAAREAAM
jgi:1-deoxy-D-xylulose-5-phosphate reductoisomerase